MGLFKNKGHGKLRNFIGKVKNFSKKHPKLTKIVKTGVGAAITLIPGGGIAARIAKAGLKNILPKVINAVKKSGRIDLDKIKQTLIKTGGKTDPQSVALVAKHIQEETGLPIDDVSAMDASDSADMLRRDPSTLTNTGDNSAYRGSSKMDPGNSSNSTDTNSNKSMMQKIKDWWNDAPMWQKVSVGVGSPVLLLTILGFTLFKGKGKKKFFGKFR